ncbi:MAG: hypothetical protein M3R63_25390 [Actinomycetota bacterium]|nr:hypothetical protein [Actinomycetota bacterium]
MALIEPLNRAQAELTAVEDELRALSAPRTIDRAEVQAMIDVLGDVGARLHRADPAKLQQFYQDLRLEMVYDHKKHQVTATVKPGRDSTGVRGATGAPPNGLALA